MQSWHVGVCDVFESSFNKASAVCLMGRACQTITNSGNEVTSINLCRIWRVFDKKRLYFVKIF